MTDPAQLPPVAVVTRFQVADFDAWKAVFDDNEPRRRAAGFVGHHINQAEGDPNRLAIYLAAEDVDRAKAFTTSDELKSIMAKSGVTSKPEFLWMTPAREAVIWDRELPAMLLTHQVEDFDAWLARYDAADELQRSNGIVGHAANRSMDDPSLAVVYHQAESFETLQSFLGSDDLKAAMKEAGVVSEPEVTFHIGGWGKQY